jgi:hypothetical protein
MLQWSTRFVTRDERTKLAYEKPEEYYEPQGDSVFFGTLFRSDM